MILQPNDVREIALQGFLPQFRGFRKTDCKRHILRTGAAIALLSAPFNKGIDLGPLSNVDCPNPLWTVEFMG